MNIQFFIHMHISFFLYLGLIIYICESSVKVLWKYDRNSQPYLWAIRFMLSWLSFLGEVGVFLFLNWMQNIYSVFLSILTVKKRFISVWKERSTVLLQYIGKVGSSPNNRLGSKCVLIGLILVSLFLKSKRTHAMGKCRRPRLFYFIRFSSKNFNKLQSCFWYCIQRLVLMAFPIQW